MCSNYKFSSQSTINQGIIHPSTNMIIFLRHFITLLFILLHVEIIQALIHPTIKIYYDSSNHLHRDIQYHPEQSSRIDVCVKALLSFIENSSSSSSLLKSQQKFELIDVSPISKTDAHQKGTPNSHIHSRPFSQAQLTRAKETLMTIHTQELVESLEMKCTSSRDRRIQEGKDALGFIGYLDHDTFLTTESYHVCLRAAACWMECVHQVLLTPAAPAAAAGQASFGFALTRPPGHHAMRLLPNGFCIFNFAAAAAVYAIEQYSSCCKRVSIIDWDVHYGQGVADIVEGYSNIRYVSMHQVPAFPYQGEKRGVSGRYKNIMTVPVQPDSTWTCGYSQMFTEHVLPFCCSCEDWKPDLVIVCAGYDALGSDELASCNLNAQDYGRMTLLLREHLVRQMGGKDKAADVKIVFGLEGGYQLEEGVPGGNLAEAFMETLKALS
jgi:acetoin utilization deacetylase AcuC-like enzyme